MRTLLPPDHPQAPKYWSNEIGGKLVPAILRYLDGRPTQPDDVMLIRAYLRQWIDSPVWDTGEPDDLAKLRKDVRELRDRSDITAWLKQALEFGIDPL